MSQFPIPLNEMHRLSVIRRLGPFDPALQASLDSLTASVCAALGVKISLVALIEEEEQIFRSRCGLDADSTPRSDAFCAYAIMRNEPLVVLNAQEDPRFADNPLVTGPPHIRFYAGAPLRVCNAKIGTLCAIDDEVRTCFSETHSEILIAMAHAVSQLLEHQLRHSDLKADTRATLALASTAGDTAQAAKQRFLRLLSHELRTPLNAIIGFTEMLQQKFATTSVPTNNEYLRIVGESGQRLLATIDLMMQYSNIEEGILELDETVFDLAEAVRESCDYVSVICGGQDIEIIQKIPDRPIDVLADRNQVVSISCHLMEYAAGLTGSGEAVTVILESSEDGILCQVCDQGSTVTDTEKAAMMRAFEEVSDGLTTEAGGIGLGLPISRLLAEAHGGRLSLATNDDLGICASLVFPAYRQIKPTVGVARHKA